MSKAAVKSENELAGSRIARLLPGGRQTLRLTGLTLLAVAILLMAYGIAAYLGWQSGQALRAERIRSETIVELERQLELARDDVVNGNNRLALRRLDWVLTRQPEDAAALALRDMAESRLAGRPTPTAAPTPAPTGTPPPSQQPRTEVQDQSSELARLQELIERQAWSEAIKGIIRFQTDYPNYERRATDQLLYESYVAHGLDLLYSPKAEMGIYYLTQASQLGDLSQEVLDQKSYAELYLQGRAFYGADWGLTVVYFRDLCLVAPFYQDACDKLFTALVALADQHAAAQDWCPAVPYYREARDYGRASDLLQKMETASEGCLSATPTPLPLPGDEITNTVPITGSFPITGTNFTP